MNTTTILSHHVAKQLLQCAEATAIEKNKSVAIAIVNEAGQLICFTKMDNNTPASGDLCIAKARHAAYYRRDTKFHEDLLKSGNNAVLALPGGVPVEGGVQLVYQGTCIGAIGVSGAASADDGSIAQAAADLLLSMAQ
jgi:glc operon protein GlcG